MRTITLLALAGCSAWAGAADFTDTALTQEKYLRSTVVQRDGSAVTRTESVRRIDEVRGIAVAAREQLSYNRSLESLDVLEAYTLKADGRKIAVAPAQIVDQQEPTGFVAPMFQDRRVANIGFPELEVGDRVVYVARQTIRTPLYPGQFEETVNPGVVKVGELRIEYDLPEGMALTADAIGFDATAPSRANGRTHYQWTFTPGPIARAESGAVDYADFGKRLIVSTFGTYANLAAAYDARSIDKAAATPEIAALARTIAGKLTDPRAQAFAVDDWVRKNIRYVALYINAGGVVPHNAAQVLANRYGDCKDHTVLMEALLGALGIDSTPALINSNLAYRLPAVPITFNHVITYIPALELYLDSTAANIAPGFLPPQLIDKDTLLTRSGKLAHTPRAQPGSVTARGVLRIGAGGDVDFENKVVFGGNWAEGMRLAYGSLSKEQLDQSITRGLQMSGMRSSGAGAVADIPGTPDQLQLSYRGHTEKMVALPGTVGVSASSSMSQNLAANVASLLQEKTRIRNFACFHGDFDEQARFELPSGVKVLAIPSPLAVRTADLEFSSDYAQDGGAVTVTRRLRMFHPGAVCTPADFALQRPILDKIARDLKAQIILDMPDA